MDPSGPRDWWETREPPCQQEHGMRPAINADDNLIVKAESNKFLGMPKEKGIKSN